MSMLYSHLLLARLTVKQSYVINNIIQSYVINNVIQSYVIKLLSNTSNEEIFLKLTFEKFWERHVLSTRCDVIFDYLNLQPNDINRLNINKQAFSENTFSSTPDISQYLVLSKSLNCDETDSPENCIFRIVTCKK